MANAEVPAGSQLLFGLKRKYPHDPTRKVYEAARYGDSVLLSEFLQEMNASERASVLKTKTFASGGEWTPLLAAAKEGNLDCVKVLLSFKADIEGRGKVLICGEDVNTYRTCTPLCVAASYGHVNVMSCLVQNGADVNARADDSCTPLMEASRNGCKDEVTFLLEHGADIDLQDKNGATALHYAVHKPYSRHVNVLSRLVESGADVNARRINDDCTPLMMASKNGNVDVITFLVEHGAKVDLQDKGGDTALHYAVSGEDVTTLHYAFHIPAPSSCTCHQTTVFLKLLALGASQVYNNHQLTPLLYACNKGKISVVEDLLQQLEYTDEQRIHALELLGASLAATVWPSTEKAFEYIKRGMRRRFKYPSHPLLKEPVEPVEAYQNRKESQTIEELSQKEGDKNSIIMESLIIRQRILGANNIELLGPIQDVAFYYTKNNTIISRGLRRHAMNIARNCNKSAILDLHYLTCDLYAKFWNNVLPKENILLELLEHVVFEYEKKQKLRNEFAINLSYLLECTVKLVQIVTKFKHCEKSKTLHESALLQRIVCLNPRDHLGNTLLHKAVHKRMAAEQYYLKTIPGFNICTGQVFKFPCPDTVKLLLNTGFSVNVVNNNGDTPLHTAVTFRTSSDKIHLLTDTLKVLLDGGAHHDFVNNDGKKAIDIAYTNEACSILSEKRKLELKCISARAVKRFEVPYLGIVPKTLEKYISRH